MSDQLTEVVTLNELFHPETFHCWTVATAYANLCSRHDLSL